MMPPGVAYGAGAVLGLIGVIRGRQAWRVLRYQGNMRRLPIYKVRSRKIPLQSPQALSGPGLSLDPETHPAPARYHPAGGPALRPAGNPVSMGAPQGGRLGIGPDSEFAGAAVPGPGLVESAGAVAGGRW